MLEVLVEAISIILSRIPSRNDQQIRKIKVCKQLKTLYKHLKRIIDDGTTLEEILSGNSKYQKDSLKSSELISLLKQQSLNISMAQQSLEQIQEIMLIKFPEVTEGLRFYLPQKGNVVNVFASLEEERQFEQAVDFFGKPVYKRTDSIDELVNYLNKHSKEGELFLVYSQDTFFRLKSSVEDLRSVIDKTCSFDELL